MRTERRKFTSIVAVILTAMLIILSLISGGAATAHAAITTSAAYEARNVMDDLKGATVDGEELDLSQYTLDSHKNVQIISFVEFCYSPFEEKQSDFGLYVYVYNPRGLDWTKNESLNKIQFKYGGAGYEKYPLQYLNRSEELGKEGLFYKFKIELTDSKKSAMLTSLNSSERVYEVSGIELYSSGINATEYKIANTYTYKGYAKGYGSDSASESTLTCTVKQAEVVELNNVKSTYYRYPTTTHTATQLNTVYFAIDNDYRNRYGKVYSITAEYNRYNLAPIAVVNDDNVYNALTEHYCDLEAEKLKTDYLLFAYSDYYTKPVDGTYLVSDWVYGAGSYWDILSFNKIDMQNPYTHYGKPLLVFKSGDTTPGERLVTRAELLKKMDKLTLEHGNGTAYGGYNDYLFDGKGTYVPVKLNADNLFDLKGFNASNSFHDWLYSFFHNTNQTIEDISPVYEVKKEDLYSDNIAKELFIAEEDVEEFKAYCIENMSKDKTVVMFRYSTADYKELPAIAIPTGVTWGFAEKDYQSVRWQTVDLGFDIITLGLKNAEEIETVLPVVMSPITVIASSEGMGSILDKETEDSDWWIYALIISAACIVIIIVTRKIKKITG